ncbi:MAG: GDP-mannose 4,6-dehydratase [Candidatus Magasanikbacteria bacterium]
MKVALITGINGFVGPYLRAELLSAGYEVYGIDKKASNRNCYDVDIIDALKLQKIILEIKPKYIFHLAGISSPNFAEENKELTFNINVDGTKNVLEVACSLHDLPRVLVVSSSHVYGDPQTLPIKETHPLLGTGVYAESRIMQEKLVSEYYTTLPIVITRSFNHTGPGQSDQFVVPLIAKQIVEIKKGLRGALELGAVDIERDISDVRDVVRAYRLLLEQEESAIICNVCRGEPISLEKIIEKFKLLSGLDELDIKINERTAHKKNPSVIYGNNNFLKQKILWNMEISYGRMIQDIYNYHLKNVN